MTDTPPLQAFPEPDESPLAQDKPAPPEVRLLHALDVFLNDLECLNDMFTEVTPLFEAQDRARTTRLSVISESLRTIATLDLEKSSPERRDTVAKLYHQSKELLHIAKKLKRADTMFRQNAVVIAVSRYDVFLGDVLRTVYRAHPHRLKGSEKTLSYSEILRFGSIDEAVEKLVEKEVDQFLRESHCEQLKLLDSMLKTRLREDLPRLDSFLEITERRNLFVHTGGTVTRQYVQMCPTLCGAPNVDAVEGRALTVTDEYLDSSISQMFEIAVRVAHTVMRKLWPDKLEHADVALNEIGFHLLTTEKWDLARRIFDFALTFAPKMLSSDYMHKLFIVNSCIAAKALNDTDGVAKLLASVDWSAATPKFTVAVAVLKSEYQKAARIVAKLSPTEPFTEDNYRTWPIFRDFRSTEEFRTAFKQLFQKDYEPGPDAPSIADEQQAPDTIGDV